MVGFHRGFPYSWVSSSLTNVVGHVCRKDCCFRTGTITAQRYVKPPQMLRNSKVRTPYNWQITRVFCRGCSTPVSSKSAKRYCSEQCRQRWYLVARRRQRHNQRQDEFDSVLRYWYSVCESCQRRYGRQRTGQRHCSNACRQKQYRDRNSLRQLATNPNEINRRCHLGNGERKNHPRLFLKH